MNYFNFSFEEKPLVPPLEEKENEINMWEDNSSSKKDQEPKNEEVSDKYKHIKNILINGKISKNILNAFKTKKERKEIKKEIKLVFKTKNFHGKGKKKKNDKSERLHNKNSLDNIIKKVKGKLIKSLIKSINIYFKESLEKIILEDKSIQTYKLKGLDYKEVSRINIEKEIDNLEKPIKEILSFNINDKSKLSKDHNKKLIEGLEKINDKNLNKLLNLKFKEWINLFTQEKPLNDSLMYFNEFNKFSLLYEISEENKEDDQYLRDFAFCIDKYEKYFRERNKKGQ